MRVAASFIAALVLLTTTMPLSASAANVFGGQISASVPCFNVAIWANVGAPRPGLFIWTPQTRRYPYGWPHTGAYTLGLYGIPYFCIVTIAPLFVLPGIAVVMSGMSR